MRKIKDYDLGKRNPTQHSYTILFRQVASVRLFLRTEIEHYSGDSHHLDLHQKVTLRSRWHSQQQHSQPQQQQSESASSRVWQQMRGTSVKIEDGEIKNDTTNTQCPTGNWKQIQCTGSSVEEKPMLESIFE